MANTYYGSQLTAAEIESALEAIDGVIAPANNGKILAIENGKIAPKSVTEYVDLNLQEKTVTPSASQQVISPDSGYNGLSTVTVNGDADLVAENIKKNVNIFGVTGNYEGGGGGGGVTVYSDVGEPSSSLGSVGDIYMKEFPMDLLIPTLTDYDTDDLEITYTGGSEYQTYYAYKAFGDNDGAGKNGTGFWNITVHFLNYSVLISYLKLLRYYSVTGGYLSCQQLEISGSNDGSTWTRIFYISASSPGTLEEFSIEDTNYYSYINFNLGASGYPGVKSVYLYGKRSAGQSDSMYNDAFYKTASGWKHIINELLKSETGL